MKGEVLQDHLLEKECRVVDKTEAQKELEKQVITHKFFEAYSDIAFYCMQSRIALRNSGLLDPLSIYEYVKYGGFGALSNVLEKNDPKNVIQEVKDSKLRGRGGAGFLTGKKWSFITDKSPKPRYMICNADEGDPGAFMDRSIIEADPHSVIEGMAIGAFTAGSSQGYIYIRIEYPLAVERIKAAIEQAREYGLLGKNIFKSGFDFDITLFKGAGAFVCGESSSLRASIQGKVPEPVVKHIHATEKGLWDKPTVLNNVETWANVPAIINWGAKWFSQIGT